MKLDQKEKDQMYKHGNDEGLKMGILIGVTSTLAFIVFSFIIFSI